MGQTESTVEEVVTPHQKLHKIVQSELTHITKFDATQLQALYASFLAENPDGNIQRKQFIAQNRELTNFGDDEFWGHIFDLFDEDQNDEISFAEWVVLLSLLKKGSAKEKVKWLFEVLDRDKSGYLSRSELEFIFSLIFVFYPQACNDRTPKDFVNQLFETLDCNHDDKLSLKEFMEGVRQFPVLFDSFMILSEIVTGEVEVVDKQDAIEGSESAPHVKLHRNRFRSNSSNPSPIEPGVDVYLKVPLIVESTSSPSQRAANEAPSPSSSSSSSSLLKPPSPNFLQPPSPMLVVRKLKSPPSSPRIPHPDDAN